MPDSKKRKKKSYYIVSKRPRHMENLRPGKHGFVVTCMDIRHRKNTITEVYSILNEYADRLYGPEDIISTKDDEEEGEENLEDALQKEVSDIKTANSKGAVRRFQNLPTKGKNVIFISTTLEDPTFLLNEIYNDLITTQIKKTKYCLRFLPVIATCYAKTDEIIKTVKQIIEPIFVEQEEHEVKKFCVVWKTRCNNAVKRDDVLPPILDFIFSKVEHKTDYNNPEIAVNIDVIGNTCCIGLLHNFVKFRKYNIDMVVEISGEKNEKSKPDEEFKTVDDIMASENNEDQENVKTIEKEPDVENEEIDIKQKPDNGDEEVKIKPETDNIENGEAEIKQEPGIESEEASIKDKSVIGNGGIDIKKEINKENIKLETVQEPDHKSETGYKTMDEVKSEVPDVKEIDDSTTVNIQVAGTE